MQCAKCSVVQLTGPSNPMLKFKDVSIVAASYRGASEGFDGGRSCDEYYTALE